MERSLENCLYIAEAQKGMFFTLFGSPDIQDYVGLKLVLIPTATLPDLLCRRLLLSESLRAAGVPRRQSGYCVSRFRNRPL